MPDLDDTDRLDQFARVQSTTRLSDARVLDYGCGRGRLTRLLYKYIPYSRLYALDPWDE
jgi:trans-aconitate methyltransferase